MGDFVIDQIYPKPGDVFGPPTKTLKVVFVGPGFVEYPDWHGSSTLKVMYVGPGFVEYTDWLGASHRVSLKSFRATLKKLRAGE